MTCAECLDRLPDDDDDPTAEVSAHLRGCPRCRARLELLQRALQAVETDLAPPVPPLHDAIWAGIAARTADQEQRAPARRDVAFAAGMAMLLMASGAVAAAWCLPDSLWPAWMSAAGSWCAGLGAALRDTGALLGDALFGWGQEARQALPSPSLAWLSLAAGAAVAVELGSRRAAMAALRVSRRGV